MEPILPESEEGQESALASLPLELRKQIFSLLDHSDLASLAQASQELRQQTYADELWQPLYKKRVWRGPDRLVSLQSTESWRQAFIQRLRIEKHGSGVTLGREQHSICLMRDGTLIKTVAEERRRGSDLADSTRGSKRKHPGDRACSGNLIAEVNRSAIADALQFSLEVHGIGDGARSLVLAAEGRPYGAGLRTDQETSSGVFDRLLSMSVDMNSAVRRAQAA